MSVHNYPPVEMFPSFSLLIISLRRGICKVVWWFWEIDKTKNFVGYSRDTCSMRTDWLFVGKKYCGILVLFMICDSLKGNAKPIIQTLTAFFWLLLWPLCVISVWLLLTGVGDIMIQRQEVVYYNWNHLHTNLTNRVRLYKVDMLLERVIKRMDEL